MTASLQRRRYAHLGLAAVAFAAAILYRFPPGDYRFYPPCPFYALTGLECPGCGATRAVAALLHGNLAGAMHSNSLVVILLPFVAMYAIAAYVRAMAGKTLDWPRPSNAAISAMLAVVMLFGVGRNLFGSSLLPF